MRPKSRKAFWIIFGCTQIIGALSLPFANVHLNPLALLGSFLLLPGLVALSVLPGDPSTSTLILVTGTVLSILINAGIWYVIAARIFRKAFDQS